MFLSGIKRKPDFVPSDDFPWALEVLRNLNEMEFRSPVTFLVGENGSGKSTLLEGLAVGARAIAAGSNDL